MMIASLVDSFIQNPTESILEQCTKEQFLKISEHYEVDIPDRKLKETVKACLKRCLIEAGVLCVQPTSSSLPSIEVRPGTLTFEQQRELLQPQLKQQLELERLRTEKEVKNLNYQRQDRACKIRCAAVLVRAGKGGQAARFVQSR